MLCIIPYKRLELSNSRITKMLSKEATATHWLLSAEWHPMSTTPVTVYVDLESPLQNFNQVLYIEVYILHICATSEDLLPVGQLHTVFTNQSSFHKFLYVCVTALRDTGWIWWAHWGHNLSHMHYFTPKGCGLCHSDTGSDSHRVASYLTNLQTIKAH